MLRIFTIGVLGALCALLLIALCALVPAGVVFFGFMSGMFWAAMTADRTPVRP